MLEAESYLKEEQIDGSMLLQIHDELIFEVKEEIVEEVAQKLKDIMENIMTLEVPLECSVNIGDSWGGVEVRSILYLTSKFF